MKPILALSIICGLSFSLNASDQLWRLHPTFDEEVTHVINTPTYVYFTSRQLPKDNGLTGNYISLFRFDKDGEELTAVTSENLLSSSPLLEVMRNVGKKYIMTVGADFSIDLIYDDGKTASIPSYKNSSISESKNVMSLVPDQKRDRVYMSTEFGYVELNDKKLEIAESRNYGEVIKSVARLGDKILLLRTGQLMSAPASEPRFSLTDYKPVADLMVPIGLYPVGENRCVLLTNGGAPHLLYILSLDENGEVVMGEPYVGNFISAEYNDQGVLVRTAEAVMQIGESGEPRFATLPAEETKGAVASDDFSTFWFGEARKGLREMKLNQSSGWSVQRDYMLPDSPSPFISMCMAQHPTEGFLVANFGSTPFTSNYSGNSPLLLSGYKGGRWTNFSQAYTAPGKTPVIIDPLGFSVDPDNPDYIYVSSLHQGMARLSLTNPEDVIHFVNPSHYAASWDSYVPLVPDIDIINSWSCRFSTPLFDAQGNLWTTYSNYDLQKDSKTALYCWLANDRRSSKSPQDIAKPTEIIIDGVATVAYQYVQPLLSNKNKDLLILYSQNYEPALSLINTNGTPTDTSDDTVKIVGGLTDQDGNDIDFHYVNVLYEDPSTGMVWVGHSEGVFYFDPQSLLSGSGRATRIKIARNDGTNLADYLLNNVQVKDILSDSAGNKWFATNGAGILCTSSDGRTILEEFTAENSPLPDNEVFKLGYVKENNSLMISTMKGLAEYRLSRGIDTGETEKVKVYPNPVRPDYYGYVTIDGLRDGSLVKIVDSAGNIVKELGPISGTSQQWDTTNLNFKKVSSGVYFILVSGSGDDNWSQVGKLLIVN